MTITYSRRTRVLAGLGACAAGGLVLGGLLAIPFSGDDGGSSVAAPTVASVATTTTPAGTISTATTVAPIAVVT